MNGKLDEKKIEKPHAHTLHTQTDAHSTRTRGSFYLFRAIPQEKPRFS